MGHESFGFAVGITLIVTLSLGSCTSFRHYRNQPLALCRSSNSCSSKSSSPSRASPHATPARSMFLPHRNSGVSSDGSASSLGLRDPTATTVTLRSRSTTRSR